jgi:hypothetical protein
MVCLINPSYPFYGDVNIHFIHNLGVLAWYRLAMIEDKSIHFSIFENFVENIVAKTQFMSSTGSASNSETPVKPMEVIKLDPKSDAYIKELIHAVNGWNEGIQDLQSGKSQVRLLPLERKESLVLLVVVL